MALSKKTVNRHNIKRAEVFKANGLNDMDIQYAHPEFTGYGSGECTLCGKKGLKWLFSIRFAKPNAMTALGKISTGIVRTEEVTLSPIGSKCINDWLDAVPETAPKLAELVKTWEVEMARCKAAMKAKVIEDLCVAAGFESADDAYDSWKSLSETYADRNLTQRLGRLRWREMKKLGREANKIKYRSCGRVLAKRWLGEVSELLAAKSKAFAPVHQPDFDPSKVVAPVVVTAPVAETATEALLRRGRAAWVNKSVLKGYQQDAFVDIGKKVAKFGKFASDKQERYYRFMLGLLEG